MKVELSPATLQRAEKFVESGEYPTVDAAIAAALEVLPYHSLTEEPEDDLDNEADADIESGRTRLLDDGYMAELRSKAEAIIASKSNRG